MSELLESEGAFSLLRGLLGDIEHEAHEERRLLWICDCDRERFLGHLKLLAAREPDLFEEGEDSLDVTCSFCGEAYTYRRDELETLH